jgi:hypothetical protein
LRKDLLRDYETTFCSPLALMVLEKIVKKFTIFSGFTLPVRKIFGIQESFEHNLMRPTLGTFLPKICFLGVIFSEKIFKEELTSHVYVYERL